MNDLIITNFNDLINLDIYDNQTIIMFDTVGCNKNVTFNIKSGTLNLKLLTLGKNDVVDEINIYLNNPDTHVIVQTLDLFKESSNVTSIVNITHSSNDTTSQLTSIAIAKDQASIKLENNGYILKNAKRTQCSQSAKGLLLSDQAEIKAEPILYIDEYDVDAHHAATVGSLNDEDLFYLMSRGLSKNDASELIIMGFIQPFIDQTNDEELKKKIKEAFTSYLSK